MATSKGTTESKKTSRPTKVKGAASSATKAPAKTAAKPTGRAAAAPKTAKAVTTSSAAKRKPAPKTNVITSEERQRMIDEAAYYIAQKRGFAGGDPRQDWLEAAAQIDRMIMETNSSKN